MVWALSGFMGSGKSTVAALLAAREPRCRMIDLDALIRDQTGRTVGELFREGGEAGFRTAETAALLDAISSFEGDETLLIALGGGTLTTPYNRELIRACTRCIYLRGKVETLAERLQEEQATRPLLQGEAPLEEKIGKLLAERRSTYEAAADRIVDIDGKSPEELADEIAKLIEF